MDNQIIGTNTIILDTPVPQLPSEVREHAKHSPSSLKEKAKCPGYRSDQSGDKSAAERGNLGHHAVEMGDPSLCKEDEVLRIAVEKILAFKANFLKKFENTVAGTTQIIKEEKLKVINQYGYFDELWIRGNQAVLIDFKFAVNEYVADSPQFWAYCIGVWDKFPQVKGIRVVVMLPFRDEIDQEQFDRDDHYDDFIANVKSIITRAENNDPETFQTGSQCAWCGVAGSCPKLSSVALTIAKKYSPEEMVLPDKLDPARVTSAETMGKLLTLARMLGDEKTGWCNKVRKAAVEMATLKGITPDGYRLQEASSPRRITNVRAAYEAVKDTVDLEDFLEITSVKIGDLEDTFSSKAPKGAKAKFKSELDVRLRDIEALEQGAPVWRLVAEKK